MQARFLPYGRQLIDEDDLEAVRQALLAPLLTTGPMVGAFESALAERLSAREAVVCANGTAALHLAMRAIGMQPGQAAIVPSITFVATANAVRYCGGDVVFADVDPDTGLLTPDTLSEALRRAPPDVRAVLPVHLNGQSCDMAGMGAIAHRRGLRIVEDACHALGATQAAGPNAVPVGASRYGDLTCFSFHPVKTIAMGEGGAITTNDPDLAAAMRRDRSHGLERDPAALTLPDAFDDDGTASPWFYEMDEPGFNYRAPDILCALGLSQLKKLDRFVAQRRKLVAAYRDALRPLGGVVTPVSDAGHGEAAWHLMVVKIDFAKASLRRGPLMRHLAGQGIGTQVHYIPVHRQPYYARRNPGLSLPGADAYYAGCLSLPLSADMTEDDVHRVVGALAAALAS